MSSEQDYYDLSPDKRTLRSLRSDVTPITAVEELVDNVLDNWRRIDSPQPGITIDIDFDFENDVFRIEDDSGGLDEENVKKIFALGGSTKEDVPNSIGSYGMGAKKAILRLGNRAVIKSRTADADIAYGFVIDEEWLHSDNWQVTKRQFDDVEPGSTVIRIEGLDIELQDKIDLEDEEEEEESIFATPKEYLELLREDLSETYDEFLKGRAGPEDGTVSILVNAVRVDEQPEIDWAYTPFDGYHPRFYKQYEISPEEIPGRDEPITVDIKAGLMRTGKSEKAGTDVIIQNRRVLTSDKTEMGGWGTHLPRFRQNLRRTRFVVKITAESHPETLPWDTQKDKIEPNSVITDRVFNVLRRAGSDYTKVDYDDFTTAYTSPYDFDNDIEDEDRESWQKVQQFNYSDRQQFIADHKPDRQLPETEQIEALVEYHETELGVFAPHIIADQYAKGYRAAFDPNNDSDGKYTPERDRVWILPDEAKRFPEQELHMILEAVKDTAERHAGAGAMFNFEEEDVWWRGYYERVLRNNDSPVNTLDATEDLEGLLRRIKARGQEQDLTNPILTGSHLRAPDLPRVFSDEGDETDEVKGTQSEIVEHTDNKSEKETTEAPTDDSTEKEPAEDETKTPTEHTDDLLTVGSNEDENSDEDSENESDGEEIDFGTTTGRQSVQQTFSDKRSVILRVRESTYASVCEAVGLEPEGAEPRDVGQAILDQNVNIYDHIESDDSGI